MFTNPAISRIYSYIRKHDGEVIFAYEICDACNLSRPTVRKYLRWLRTRNLIKMNRRRIQIVPI